MELNTDNRVPRTPMYAYGVTSPPPSGKSTMVGQNQTGRMSRLFSPTTPPSPRNQIVPFQPGMAYVDTPEQIPATINYPTRTSHSSQSFNDLDPWAQQQFQIFLRMQQANAQKQAHQQQWQQQQMPPNSIPQGAGYQPQPHRDSGYATQDDSTSTCSSFGLPGQQSQGTNANEGHTYGLIKAKGNAKVVMGNVNDSCRPVPWLNRKHNYAGGELDENAQIAVGDTTYEGMERFLRG